MCFQQRTTYPTLYGTRFPFCVLIISPLSCPVCHLCQTPRTHPCPNDHPGFSSSTPAPPGRLQVPNHTCLLGLLHVSLIPAPPAGRLRLRPSAPAPSAGRLQPDGPPSRSADQPSLTQTTFILAYHASPPDTSADRGRRPRQLRLACFTSCWLAITPCTRSTLCTPPIRAGAQRAATLHISRQRKAPNCWPAFSSCGLASSSCNQQQPELPFQQGLCSGILGHLYQPAAAPLARAGGWAQL